MRRNDTVQYNTRDGKGNDIVTKVTIKKYTEHPVNGTCPICMRQMTAGCKIKDIVSANFTDWQYVGDYICPECADLFSLYFYNYVVDPDGIHLYNVREIKDAILTPWDPPYMICITTSRKKHLFYKARWNDGGDRFAINLETETIYTTRDRMAKLFAFVECLQTLGASKEALKDGQIPFLVFLKIDKRAMDFLKHELDTSREIQIPLFCGQKLNISEEDACTTISTLISSTEPRPHFCSTACTNPGAQTPV